MNCKEIKKLKKELKEYKENIDSFSEKEKYAKLKSMQDRLNDIFLNPSICNECLSEAKILLTEFSLN